MAEQASSDSVWRDESRDLTRVLALSDGVFAIAMTLLAIDLILPEIRGGLVSQALAQELFDLVPKFFAFALAFYLVLVKWMAHRRMFAVVTRVDSTLLWLNGFFLLWIAFMPVPTAALGRYPSEPLALIFFGVTQIITTAVQWGMWLYITGGRRLIAASVNDETIRFFNVRNAVQIALLAIVTLVAVFNVWLALGLMLVGIVAFTWFVGRERRRHVE
jgi:uncharacterized membrane protein